MTDAFVSDFAPLRSRSVHRPKGAVQALVVYMLYCVGFLLPGTAICGFVFAHYKRRDADPMPDSHLEWQVRTFAIGLGGLLVTVTTGVLSPWVGMLTLIVWTSWALARCLTGLVKLSRNEPVETPRSWGLSA